MIRIEPETHILPIERDRRKGLPPISQLVVPIVVAEYMLIMGKYSKTSVRI